MILKSRDIQILCLCSLLILGCSSRRERQRPPVVTGDVAERVGDIVLLNLEAPAFASLSPDARRCAYYLSRAVLAGRDISYDQINPRSVESRNFLEKISLNINYAAPDYYVQPFMQYLKAVWIHSGFYDLNAGSKLPATIGQRELTQLIFLALANSGGQLGSLLDVNLKENYLLDTLANPAFDSTLFVQLDPSSADSPVNIPSAFYENVRAAQLQSFPQKYPHNSRLVARGDRLVELVWRAGDEELAPGPFAQELGKVIENLEKARPYLSPQRVLVVDQLIRHLRTGSPASFDSAASAWRTTTSPLDFVLGFTDRRYDPLGNKGLWTGLLFLADDEAQTKISMLQAAAAELLKDFPGWIEVVSQGRQVKAVQLLTAVGANGPLCPDVCRDPLFLGPGESSQQSLIFTNVLGARVKAKTRVLAMEFYTDAQDSAPAQRYAEGIAFASAALSEVLDLKIDDFPPAVENLPAKPPEVLAAVQRELALLWLLHDPRLIDLGLLPDPAALDEAYRSFAREFLMELAKSKLSRGGQARRLIGNYLLASGGSLKLEKLGDRTFCRLLDADLMRSQIADLAQQIEDLERSRDRQPMSGLWAKYSAQPDNELRDEIAARLHQVGAFTQAAYILPLVEADFNPMGGLEAVHLEKPANFAAEMLIFSGFEPRKKKE